MLLVKYSADKILPAGMAYMSPKLDFPGKIAVGNFALYSSHGVVGRETPLRATFWILINMAADNTAVVRFFSLVRIYMIAFNLLARFYIYFSFQINQHQLFHSFFAGIGRCGGIRYIKTCFFPDEFGIAWKITANHRC